MMSKAGFFVNVQASSNEKHSASKLVPIVANAWQPCSQSLIFCTCRFIHCSCAPTPPLRANQIAASKPIAASRSPRANQSRGANRSQTRSDRVHHCKAFATRRCLHDDHCRCITAHRSLQADHGKKKNGKSIKAAALPRATIGIGAQNKHARATHPPEAGSALLPPG